MRTFRWKLSPALVEVTRSRTALRKITSILILVYFIFHALRYHSCHECKYTQPDLAQASINSGVSYYVLSDSVGGVPGVWHIFVKSKSQELGETHFRGFWLFEETINASLYGNRILSYPEVSRNLKLQVVASDCPEIQVIYQLSDDSLRPSYFSFNASNACSNLRVLSNDKMRYLLLDQNDFEHEENPLKEGLYHILSPPHGLSNEIFGFLLCQFIEYHAQLGISGTLIYLREGQNIFKKISTTLSNKYSVLIRKGLLRVYRWKYMNSPNDDQKSRYFDQPVVYNHAILSFMNTQVRLYISDLDEYLILNHTNHRSIHHKIWNLLSGHVSIARYNYILDVPTLKQWCNLHDAPKSEVEIWMTCDSKKVWSSYKYRQKGKDIHKSIVDPSHVWGFAVHEGKLETEHVMTSYDQDFIQSTYIAHFIHLYKINGMPEDMIIDYLHV